MPENFPNEIRVIAYYFGSFFWSENDGANMPKQRPMHNSTLNSETLPIIWDDDVVV